METGVKKKYEEIMINVVNFITEMAKYVSVEHQIFECVNKASTIFFSSYSRYNFGSFFVFV